MTWTKKGTLLPAVAISQPQLVTDWNAVSAPGYYYGVNAANGPKTASFTAQVMCDPPNSNALTLILTRLVSSDNPEIWFRQRRGDTAVWNSWYQVPMLGAGAKNLFATQTSVSFSANTLSAGTVVNFPAGRFAAPPIVTANAISSSLTFCESTGTTTTQTTIFGRFYDGTARTATVSVGVQAMDSD